MSCSQRSFVAGRSLVWMTSSRFFILEEPLACCEGARHLLGRVAQHVRLDRVDPDGATLSASPMEHNRAFADPLRAELIQVLRPLVEHVAELVDVENVSEPPGGRVDERIRLPGDGTHAERTGDDPLQQVIIGRIVALRKPAQVERRETAVHQTSGRASENFCRALVSMLASVAV